MGKVSPQGTIRARYQHVFSFNVLAGAARQPQWWWLLRFTDQPAAGYPTKYVVQRGSVSAYRRHSATEYLELPRVGDEQVSRQQNPDQVLTKPEYLSLFSSGKSEERGVCFSCGYFRWTAVDGSTSDRNTSGIFSAFIRPCIVGPLSTYRSLNNCYLFLLEWHKHRFLPVNIFLQVLYFQNRTLFLPTVQGLSYWLPTRRHGFEPRPPRPVTED
jgi:hypothetical protein